MFANRLLKNFKHVSKWAKRNHCNAFRIYDRDIPEIPYAVDVYADCFVIYGYDRPNTPLDPKWAMEQVSQRFETPMEKIFYKTRSRQEGLSQYEKSSSLCYETVVLEFGLKFIVNLSDYLDTGLFLDHRLTRQQLGQLCKRGTFLNLFCYTGSGTVHAALGGAESSISVDMSNTYTSWAKRNLELNNINSKNHVVVREDVLIFLNTYREQKFDTIFVDPPSFSNSTKMANIFDIQRDHESLLRQCMELLNPQGRLLFSNNLRTFKMSQKILENFNVTNITQATLPIDYRNNRIHNAWLLQF